MELEDVFRAHQKAVFAYFYRIVGNRHDAEELTQETFVRACGAAIRFRGDSKVTTWLFGIARRVLLEAARAGLFEHRPELPDAPAPAAMNRTNGSTSSGRLSRSESATERHW